MDQKAQIAIEITRQGSGARDAESDLARLEAQAAKTDKAGAALASSWKAAGAALTALVSARIIKDAVHEFSEFERAAKLLDGSLIAAGQHSREYSDELKRLASEMADMAKVQDDVVLSAQATLVQFGALREEMPRLTRNMLDMSAAGFDLQTVARNLGAAVSGEFEPMRRLLKIDFPEGASRAEKLAMILDTMEKRFSGLAASQASTTSGFRELSVAFSEAKQQLGQFVSEGLGAYTRHLASALSATTEFVQWLGKLGAGNIGSKEEFALTDQVIKLRSELTRIILQKERDAEITSEQSAALREHIRTMTTAEDMYRRLAMVRAFLRGEGDLPVNIGVPIQRTLDPDEVAARELAQLRDRLKLYRATNFAATWTTSMGTAWMPNQVIGAYDQIRREQEQIRILLNSQFDRGLITAEQWRAALAETKQRYILETAELAREGAAEVDRTHKASLSLMQQEQFAIDEMFKHRRQLIEDYYQYELEKAGETAHAAEIINTNKEATLQLLDQQRIASLNEVKLKYDETHLIIKDITRFASLQFASGFSRAFVDFISGTKEAKDAFREFAREFMASVAQMIMQLLILRAIKAAFGPSIIGLAHGGVVQAAAAGTIAGVSMVTSPTFFPRFNVLAGEAGAEHLAVLSRSRTLSIGGINAIVGNVGPSRLALIDASHLASLAAIRKAADGILSSTTSHAGQPAAQTGAPVAGAATVNIRLAPGLRAEIVDESITGAQIRIINDLHEDSAISSAVKRLTS